MDAIDEALLADPEQLVFLADRSEQDWATLIGAMRRTEFVPGDELMRAGEDGRELCLIISGSLMSYTPDGREYKRLDAPSIVGEIAFLDGRPRSLTVRARTEGEMLRLSFAEFEALAMREPELGRALLVDLGRIVATRLRAATDFIAAAIAED